MSKTCGECKHFQVDAVAATCEKKLWICDDDTPACKKFEPAAPPTNGDKIRQMSNEELAVLLNQCDYMIAEAFHGRRDLFSSCYDMWLKWLNAPAESEEEDE